MTNFLGLTQLPLIEDRTANYEVWNQPVVGYEVTKQAKVSASAANTCVGNTGTSWTYNTAAKDLYEVKMTVSYVVEGYPSTRPVGYRDNISTDDYHYILELNSAGKIIGGRFCTDSENAHVDFLWSPTGSWNPTNPNVKVENVKKLIEARGRGRGHRLGRRHQGLQLDPRHARSPTTTRPARASTSR